MSALSERRPWPVYGRRGIIRPMIVDVHCHLALSARRVDPAIERFSFEPEGARGMAGFDAYMPPRMVRSIPFRFLARRLGLDASCGPGEELDLEMERVWRHHLLECPGVDKIALLAFDEYHTDDGEPLGPVGSGMPRGSSLYVSNSLVHAWCVAHPQKLLFCASVHPYRRGAVEALEEVHARGAVLMKWLPVTQNIDPTDERTLTFVHRAGELGMPLLIHYGGERTLRRQHAAQENPQPMLELLARLHRGGVMPPTIIAHVATPSLPWQRRPWVQYLLDAMTGPLADAPLYADIAALYYKGSWLKRIVDDPTFAPIRNRLVFGSDFPVMPTTLFLWRRVRGHRAEIQAATSWVERSMQIMRAAGFDEAVFDRGGEVLGLTEGP